MAVARRFQPWTSLVLIVSLIVVGVLLADAIGISRDVGAFGGMGIGFFLGKFVVRPQVRD